MPGFPYAGLYLGLPAIFRAGVDNRVHTGLVWSPDTSDWRRLCQGTALIPLSEEEGACDWGCIYAAATPVVLQDEIRIYYAGEPGKHAWNPGYLCLATLRPDGWAGYEPEDRSRRAVVETTSVACSGGTLRLTADAAGGAVKAEVLDPDGETLTHSQPVTGDVTVAAVAWTDGFSLSELKGAPCRLRFRIENAKLYSFSFER